MTTLPADELVKRLRGRSPNNYRTRSRSHRLDDKAAADLIEAQAAEISSLRVKLAEAMEVVDAAKGLCFGEDWNKGSHAIKHGYRAKLISAIGKMFPDHPCAARRLIEGNGNERL